jgi:hypothetical protein
MHQAASLWLVNLMCICHQQAPEGRAPHASLSEVAAPHLLPVRLSVYMPQYADYLYAAESRRRLPLGSGVTAAIRA